MVATGNLDKSGLSERIEAPFNSFSPSPLRYTRSQFRSRGQGGGQPNPLSSDKDLERGP